MLSVVLLPADGVHCTVSSKCLLAQFSFTDTETVGFTVDTVGVVTFTAKSGCVVPSRPNVLGV